MRLTISLIIIITSIGFIGGFIGGYNWDENSSEAIERVVGC